MLDFSQIQGLLGDEAEDLLNHTCTGVPADQLHLPGPGWLDEVREKTDRSIRVVGALHTLFNHGNLTGTGYVSILPVDQGVEHSGAASFEPNPIYFDPENIVKLALEGGCNAVASTYGVLAAIARKYAHKIPMILKFNNNELLTHPNVFDMVSFASIDQAWKMGCMGVGATIYYGSAESRRQIQEVTRAFEYAHELGMFTVLWCYLRNSAFKVDDKDYHASADLTGQANHLGVTIGADIVKQKQPTINRGYEAMNAGEAKFGKHATGMYDTICQDHPIDMCRFQVVNCYMGRVGLINSGGASGDNDLAQAVRTAVINKRAGGTGVISGRKSFQKPMEDGVKLLNAIQSVLLCEEVTVA
ncbi:class I fructose-bisphosphate aldolase [Patescibacteria group bacterium]|nr:class I fructose-bisphosphate aldolase [Patescibacteria group bacterium]